MKRWEVHFRNADGLTLGVCTAQGDNALLAIRYATHVLEDGRSWQLDKIAQLVAVPAVDAESDAL